MSVWCASKPMKEGWFRPLKLLRNVGANYLETTLYVECTLEYSIANKEEV